MDPRTLDVLQPLDAAEVEASVTYLSSTPEHVLWGRLPCRTDAPVARITPGDELVVDTLSHEGLMPDQGSDPLRYFTGHGVAAEHVLSDAIAVVAELERDPATDGPHVVTGPVAVTGAQPGDLLAITVVALEPRVPYGVVSTRHGKGVLAGDTVMEGDYGAFCTAELGEGGELIGRIRLSETDASTDHPASDSAAATATFPLDPFLGVVGVAPDSDERPNSVPPGLYGGNIDIKDLTVGTTLFLPVQVPEALLYVGDPHFAQGDGEVALTALEASLRARLRVEVIPAVAVAGALAGVEGPIGLADGVLLPTGLDLDLDVALQKAVTNAIALLANLVGAEPHRAYLYLSAAADFHISQAVDIVKGVHGRIRLADFGAHAPGEFAERLWAGAGRAADGTGIRSAAGAVAPDAPAAAQPTAAETAGLADADEADGAAPAGPAAIDGATWRAVGAPLVPAAGSGPLDGQTVAVKDLYAVRGFSTGAGIPEFATSHEPAVANAAAVDTLLGAGAAVVGIAQTDQLAYSIGGRNRRYGVPLNPAFPERLPGGSSSGSASAVARGWATIGLGTDTAGSIRVPAAYQGLWGIRTTHGLVDRSGLLPLADSFDAIGWLARDGATLERVAEVLTPGTSAGAFAGFVASPQLVALAAGEAGDATTRVAAKLDAVAQDAPIDLEAAFAAFRTVQGFEAWAVHGEWVSAHPGVLDDDVAGRFADAASVTETDAGEARATLATARAALRSWLGERVLVLPTTSGPAPLLTASAEDIDLERGRTLRLTCLASLAGLPAVAAPILGGESGPTSVCFVAAGGTDLALIRAVRSALGRAALD